MTRDLQSNIDSFNAALASTKNDLESSMKMLDSATQQNSITEIKSFENDLKASIDGKVSGKAIAITTKKSGGGSYSISSDVISGGGEDKKSHAHAWPLPRRQPRLPRRKPQGEGGRVIRA